MDILFLVICYTYIRRDRTGNIIGHEMILHVEGKRQKRLE